MVYHSFIIYNWLIKLQTYEAYKSQRQPYTTLQTTKLQKRTNRRALVNKVIYFFSILSCYEIANVPATFLWIILLIFKRKYEPPGLPPVTLEVLKNKINDGNQRKAKKSPELFYMFRYDNINYGSRSYLV